MVLPSWIGMDDHAIDGAARRWRPMYDGADRLYVPSVDCTGRDRSVDEQDRTASLFDPQKIILASELNGLRLDRRTERRPDGSAVLARIRRGAYYDAADWSTFSADTRYLALVHATAMYARASHQVYSHWSAAAVWHLPTVECWPSTVHATVCGGIVHSSGLVRRHSAHVIPPSVMIDGVRVTTLPRTLVDLARDGSLQSAVAAADHALRHGMCTSAELATESALLEPGHPGVTGVRAMVALADPRAESPLESLSRVAMYELRVVRPELQVLLVDGDGEFGRSDFGWDGVVGECDGYAKYIRYLRPGEEPGDAVWREKRREDRIRRTGARVARWGWSDALGRVGMLRALEEQGIRRLPRRRWL